MLNGLFSLKMDEFKKDRVDQLNLFSKELESQVEKYRTVDNKQAGQLIDALRRLRKIVEQIHTNICLRQDYNLFNYQITRWQKKLNREGITEIKPEFESAMDLYEKYLYHLKKSFDGELSNDDANNTVKILKEFEKKMREGVLMPLIRLNNAISFPKYTSAQGFQMDGRIEIKPGTFGLMEEKYMNLDNKFKKCRDSFDELLTFCKSIDYMQIRKIAIHM